MATERSPGSLPRCSSPKGTSRRTSPGRYDRKKGTGKPAKARTRTSALPEGRPRPARASIGRRRRGTTWLSSLAFILDDGQVHVHGGGHSVGFRRDPYADQPRHRLAAGDFGGG